MKERFSRMLNWSASDLLKIKVSYKEKKENGLERQRKFWQCYRTVIQAAANATKLVYTSTGGAAVDLCATLDVTGSAVRKILKITGTKIDAMALSADEGVLVTPLATPLVLTPGILSLNCAATTTGAIDWYVLYEPLAPGANMS